MFMGDLGQANTSRRAEADTEDLLGRGRDDVLPAWKPQIPRAISSQKPTKGPNENAKNARSSGPTSAASSTNCQHSIHHRQSSAVSSTGIGRPRVPEVWW